MCSSVSLLSPAHSATKKVRIGVDSLLLLFCRRIVVFTVALALSPTAERIRQQRRRWRARTHARARTIATFFFGRRTARAPSCLTLRRRTLSLVNESRKSRVERVLCLVFCFFFVCLFSFVFSKRTRKIIGKRIIKSRKFPARNTAKPQQKFKKLDNSPLENQKKNQRENHLIFITLSMKI